MGECCYYMKAKFPKRTLKKVSGKIQTLWSQGQHCYMFWQDHRDKDSKEFWPKFEEKYPEVCEYLKHAGLYKDKSFGHSLSGMLDFGDSDNLTMEKDELNFYSEVWHMADWQPLANYLKHIGAKRVVWDTEENGCGSLDNLEFYNYAGIVEDILKNKILLPSLIGLNKELDELIEEKIK